MKKNLLIGCMTALFLSPAMAEEIQVNTPASPDVVAQDVRGIQIQIPSADEIKNAFRAFIENQTQLGQLFDLSQMSVVAEGENFLVTLPETQKVVPVDAQTQETKTLSIPEKKITLTYADSFDDYAQYRIDSVFDIVQSLIKDAVPEASLTVGQSNSEILWVPYYNLITKNSQNIQNLVLNLPDVLNLTVGSVVSDSLARALGNKKMDRSDLQDVKDIKITAEGTTISIPTFSFEDAIQNADLGVTGIRQLTSSEKAFFNLNIPTVVVSADKEHMGSLSLAMNGEYQNTTMHLEIKSDNITLNQMMIPLPSVFLPSEISLNVDVQNLNKEALNLIMDENTTDEERTNALRTQVSNIRIRINKLEVKNAEAGISVSGILQNEPNAIGLSLPKANLTAVITNLDKLAPEVKVDAQQCERVKAQMATLSDRNIAEQAIQNACAPQGGILSALRPYIDLQKRTVNADGTTTDTVNIIIVNNRMIINGKEVK